MDEGKFKEVEKHVPVINQYLEEVQYVEDFINERNLDSDKTTLLFWNHLITLFERVDESDQNNFDLDEVDELSKESEELTKDFEAYINDRRPFDLTAFEHYLMQVHFEQIIKGEV